MKIEVNKKLCLAILQWCETQFGESKYQPRFPKLRFRSRPPKKNLCGEFHYKKNEIFVYAGSHVREDNPILAVVNTILHEYRHYLQNMHNYEIYFKKYTYSEENHPYEKTCEEFAKWFQHDCYSYILRTYKNGS